MCVYMSVYRSCFRVDLCVANLFRFHFVVSGDWYYCQKTWNVGSMSVYMFFLPPPVCSVTMFWESMKMTSLISMEMN